jgi:hypothetical protein
MPTSQGFRGLRVYQLAFKLAMEIYNESKHFPPEEKYSLIKFVVLLEVWQRTLGRDIGGSSIQRCLLARCQMPMARQQKPRSG